MSNVLCRGSSISDTVSGDKRSAEILETFGHDSARDSDQQGVPPEGSVTSHAAGTPSMANPSTATGKASRKNHEVRWYPEDRLHQQSSEAEPPTTVRQLPAIQCPTPTQVGEGLEHPR